MTKYGWKPGSRLGRVRNDTKSSCSRGLLHPISIAGSLPKGVRTGVGFRVPKRLIPRGLVPCKPCPPVYIRSVFDTPEVVAYRTGESVMLSHNRPDPMEEVKYRSDWVPKKRTVILTPNASRGLEGIRFQSGGVLNPDKLPAWYICIDICKKISFLPFILFFLIHIVFVVLIGINKEYRGVLCVISHHWLTLMILNKILLFCATSNSENFELYETQFKWGRLERVGKRVLTWCCY